MERKLYQILGVSSVADSKEIKRAYRKLAKQYHPDTNQGNPQAEIRFKEVKEAYEILGDPAKKEVYDSQQKNSTTGSGFQNTTQQKANQARYSSTEDVREDLEKQFEQFFGYSPKTKEKTATGKRGKNPMDTSDLFGSFFNMGKK